jgi:MFS family permease
MSNPWLAQTFASMRYRNFRLWFFGQLVSMVGTWMQSTAQGYLVFELTGSPAYLGYVSFAAGVPTWIFMLWAGVIADRMDRRKLLAIIQSCMMLPAIILAILTFTGLVQPWHILILAVMLGTANAFDGPIRQALLPELVEDRRDLTNAIALNAALFNSAVVIGPAIGGLAYAWLGPGWCFTFNAVSFLAVITALLMMRVQYLPQSTRRHISLQEMAAGLVFVAKNRAVLLLTLTIGMASIFGIGLMTLIPAWAVNILHGGPQTNGVILSARGIGALAGALAVASLGQMRYRGRLWASGLFILPIMMLLFSFSRYLPLSLFIMVLTGLGFVFTANTSNALIQTRIPDELRGRVMSAYLLVFFGSFPIGSMLAGQMAEYLGEPLTLVISSLVLLVYVAFLFLRFPEMRNLE